MSEPSVWIVEYATPSGNWLPLPSSWGSSRSVAEHKAKEATRIDVDGIKYRAAEYRRVASSTERDSK